VVTIDSFEAPSMPKYYRVKSKLLELVRSLPPGTMLAPERVLSVEFATSRTTVRQALQELVLEGWLSREQGRGTFVAPRKLAQPLRVGSFTEYMRAAGLQPQSRYLAFAYVPASADIAGQLGVREGARLIHLERLRLGSDEPMALESTYLAASRFPGLRKVILAHESLYAALESHYDVRLNHAEQTIETVLATPRDAALLATDVGAPLLLLSQCTHDVSDEPVEYVRSLYRGDRYKFLLHISRDSDPI
jgi:GntR family transcriptional regulator